MGQTLHDQVSDHPAGRLTDDQLDRLRAQIIGAADQMTDDQILTLADSLHNALRMRRALRTRVHQRVEHRLHA